MVNRGFGIDPDLEMTRVFPLAVIYKVGSGAMAPFKGDVLAPVT